MILKNTLLFALIIFIGQSLCAQPAAETDSLYHEHYRNQYHFSARHGWISDPCGFLYYEGFYHCYWWGGAESKDLVHFDEVSRYVQREVPKGQECWTGCVVADKHNTAGFGEGKYISCLTFNDPANHRQTQGLTISEDHGRSFTYYSGNPVLDIGLADFRDPTIIWYEPAGQWLMVVSKTLESKVAFYLSPDLKNWTWLSDFGPAGRTYRSFECPDIVQLPIENGPHKGEYRWVLIVSVDWINMQYFVGDFDGREFHAEQLWPEEGLYVDCAPDFYAARTIKDFDGSLNGEVYMMGWMSNWRYCRDLPMTYGKGFWSVARRLSLVDTPDGLRLSQLPKEEVLALRGQEKTYSGRLRPGTKTFTDVAKLDNTYMIEADFEVLRDNYFGLMLCEGEGRRVVVSYDVAGQTLVVDRTHVMDFRMEKTEYVTHAKIAPINGHLRLKIFVDKCAIEIFSEDGTKVFSIATFAADSQTGMSLFSTRTAQPYTLHVYPMQSIWNKK